MKFLLMIFLLAISLTGCVPKISEIEEPEISPNEEMTQEEKDALQAEIDELDKELAQISDSIPIITLQIENIPEIENPRDGTALYSELIMPALAFVGFNTEGDITSQNIFNYIISKYEVQLKEKAAEKVIALSGSFIRTEAEKYFTKPFLSEEVDCYSKQNDRFIIDIEKIKKSEGLFSMSLFENEGDFTEVSVVCIKDNDWTGVFFIYRFKIFNENTVKFISRRISIADLEEESEWAKEVVMLENPVYYTPEKFTGQTIEEKCEFLYKKYIPEFEIRNHFNRGNEIPVENIFDITLSLLDRGGSLQELIYTLDKNQVIGIPVSVVQKQLSLFYDEYPTNFKEMVNYIPEKDCIAVMSDYGAGGDHGPVKYEAYQSGDIIRVTVDYFEDTAFENYINSNNYVFRETDSTFRIICRQSFKKPGTDIDIIETENKAIIPTPAGEDEEQGEWLYKNYIKNDNTQFNNVLDLSSQTLFDFAKTGLINLGAAEKYLSYEKEAFLKIPEEVILEQLTYFFESFNFNPLFVSCYYPKDKCYILNEISSEAFDSPYEISEVVESGEDIIVLINYYESFNFESDTTPYMTEKYSFKKNKDGGYWFKDRNIIMSMDNNNNNKE